MCLSIAVHHPERVLAKGEHRGFEWVTTHNTIGFRCGYVRVPRGHPWHGKDLDEVDEEVKVHGGLTFAEPDEPCDGGRPDDASWLGFDCFHAFDLPDPDLPRNPELGTILDAALYDLPGHSNHLWTQAEVEAECLLLCEQAAAAAR